MVNNVQPKYRNTLRGTYAGDQYDVSGRQRGTLILLWNHKGCQWDAKGRQRVIMTQQ